MTYADFVTNRYESVFKQLQTDIEVERAYDAFEDVLFIENKDGNLVLAKPYEFTINKKIYSYEAGTPRESIWKTYLSFIVREQNSFIVQNLKTLIMKQ